MGSWDISLRETRGRGAQEDIIDRPGKEERFHDCRVSGLLVQPSGADTVNGAAHAQRCYDFQCQELGTDCFTFSLSRFPLSSEEPEPGRDDG